MRIKFLKYIWGIYFFLLFLILFCIIGIKIGWIGYMPPLDELQNPIDKYASQILSSDGKLLGTWSKNDNRIFVNYDSISPNVFNALVATEDVRFYQHDGIDGRAVIRAIIKRGILGKKSAGGGSTITQQLAKQLYSSTAKNTLQRMFQKPIEWVIAIELERHYTKNEILTLYLNYFDFLHNAVGIKTAAKVYFNKNPKSLSINEAALLVGMCKNPAYFNPIREPERCIERRNVVLQQMVKAGFLNYKIADSLKKKPLALHFHRIDHKIGLATYMREYLRRILMAKKPNKSNYRVWQTQQFYEDSLAWVNNPLYGWCNKNVKKDGNHYDIYTDGLKIYTTIDSKMQQYAEQSVFNFVAKELQPKFNLQKKTHRNFPYSNDLTRKQIIQILQRSVKQSDRYWSMKVSGATEKEIQKVFRTPVDMTIYTYHGEVDTVMSPMDSIKYYKSFLRSGLISIDPMNGYVKAYVGGLNYKHFQYDMAMVGRRQIGSTMKPFVYAMAMEDGMSPDYMVLNAQRTYNVGAGQTWTPRNGSYSRYGQMVPLRWGLSQSNNWVTAGLMSLVDPTGHRLKKLLGEVGIANPDIYPSMALCLGPCDITVGELASAYTMFVNKGIRCAPILVTKIEDGEGNVIAEFSPRMNEIIREKSAEQMLKMLEGVVDYGTAKRLRFKYHIEGDIAGKTGTTNKNSDGWFVGIIPKLITVCWVGGEDRDVHFSSTSLGQGASVALPIWANYIKKIYKNEASLYSPKDKFDFSALINNRIAVNKNSKDSTNLGENKNILQKTPVQKVSHNENLFD